MVTQDFLQELQERRDTAEDNIVRFTAEEINGFTAEDAGMVVQQFSGQAMMLLPESEIAFFEWMKKNDPPVWNELWGDQPYTVSIAFLRSFVGDAHGFPVSDLDGVNYYFHRDFIIDIEKEKLVSSLVRKTREQEVLSMEDVFILEIWIHPTDIWHFAYKYGYDINDAKAMIRRLEDEGIILHPKKREEVAAFVEW